MLNSTSLCYSILTIMSIGKKSFENMGRFLNKTGEIVARYLMPASDNFKLCGAVAQKLFADNKELCLVIDQTLIKKFFAKLIQGTGKFYDTKIGRKITAFNFAVASITDGKFKVPIGSSYFFDKESIEMMDDKPLSRDEVTKLFIKKAQDLFPKTILTILADGAYSTIDFLKWCVANKIRAEMRMGKNRKVEINGKKMKLSELLDSRKFRPRGRQMARKFSVKWHDLSLELTIERRFDKNENESFVFLVATYKALPREHVAMYKKRWTIEKIFRTTKQHLGLQECFSKSFAIQDNHTSAVLLAYALTQLEMKTYRLKIPEDAINQLKKKNATSLQARFDSILSPFYTAMA